MGWNREDQHTKQQTNEQDRLSEPSQVTRFSNEEAEFHLVGVCRVSRAGLEAQPAGCWLRNCRTTSEPQISEDHTNHDNIYRIQPVDSQSSLTVQV